MSPSRGKGIGGHTLANNGAFDTWLTPPSILHALGSFDLDPCAGPSPRPWPTAYRHIELPEDGLSAEWKGRVFLNPPYGTKTAAWVERMAKHNQGIVLIFARVETDYWQRWIWPFAQGVLFIANRLNFHLPDGTRAKGNAGGPSALIAYGTVDARLLEYSGIKGAFVVPRNCFTNEFAPEQYPFRELR